MPITRREFEKGQLDPSLLVEEFLRSNLDYAFTLTELMEGLASEYTLAQLLNGLMSKGAQFTAEDLQNIIDALVEKGRIESETVTDEVYYIYRKAMGLKP